MKVTATMDRQTAFAVLAELRTRRDTYRETATRMASRPMAQRADELSTAIEAIEAALAPERR